MLSLALFWLPPGLVLFGLVTKYAAADAGSNYFIWPPPANGTSRTDGGDNTDNIALTWSTNASVMFNTNYLSYTVDLYQNLPQEIPVKQHQFVKTVYNHVVDNSDQTDSTATGNTTVPWEVATYDASTLDSKVFFFWIQDAGDPTQQTFFMSHYFNITENSTPSGSIPPASITSSGTSSPTTSVIISPTIGAADANTAATTDTPSANTMLKLALGIGLGIGIPLLLVLAFLAFRLQRRHAHTDSRPTNSADSFIEPINQKSHPSKSSSIIDEEHDTGTWNAVSPVMVVEKNKHETEEIHEIPDHAVHEAPIRHPEPIYEAPDHAVVEAPGDLTMSELSATRRFSWERRTSASGQSNIQEMQVI